MSVEVFTDIVQKTPEWFAIKSGIPSASVFKEVMQKPGPRGGIPKGRQTLMWKLAGEIITGEPMDSYTNSNMDRGAEREAEARDLYAFLRDVEPVQVGFIKNGNCGCSPDALIDDDGLWECKDAFAHVQIERLLKDILPPEHLAQCQGQLMVSQRNWVDWMSHSRGLPPLIVRIERDEAYIDALRIDVNDFVEELNELVQKIGSM